MFITQSLLLLLLLLVKSGLFRCHFACARKLIFSGKTGHGWDRSGRPCVLLQQMLALEHNAARQQSNTVIFGTRIHGWIWNAVQ